MSEVHKPNQQPSLTDAGSEFDRLQFTQSMQTYRAQFTLLVQIATVLVIADVTIVGYAITERIASLLLIGALFPLGILYSIYAVYRLTLPVVYTIISLENKYGGLNANRFASTFLAFIRSPEYVDTLRSIGSVGDPWERIERLRHVSLPHLGSGKGIGRAMLISVMLGQIAASIVLAMFFNWRFL